MSYETSFLKALALTLTLEVLVMVFVCRRYYPVFHLPQITLAGIVPTLTTLPYVWFVFPALVHDYQIYGLVSELFALTSETFLIAILLRTGTRTGFILSFSSNMVSFTGGLMATRFDLL